MKLKLDDLRSYMIFYNAVAEQTMPFSISYKLNKINRLVTDEIKYFDDKLQGIISTYGKRDEDGKYETTESGGIAIQEDKLAECSAKIEELNDVEVEIEDIWLDETMLDMLTAAPNIVNGVVPFIKKEAR